MGVGTAGVAVLATVVVILAGADARFVTVNVKGPPNAPEVIFCKANVAGLGVLVKVHRIFAKGFRLVAGTVITLPASVPKLAGFPVVMALVSVQVPVDTLKLLLAASVNVTGLRMLVTEM